MGLKIIGTGRKLPERIVSNDELTAFLDTSDSQIIAKTGVKTRAICTSESLSDLAGEAGRLALAKSGLTAADMDLIICATMTADYIIPALACVVQKKLGAKCPAFDVSAACTGFIYALDIAHSYLDSGKAKNILIISADMMSRRIDWSDKSTCILFGDGAGACVVTQGEALKYIKLSADGNIEPLYIQAGSGNSPFAENRSEQGYLTMQGQNVFKFAVKSIEDEVRQALAALNLSEEDVGYYLLHQANNRIIESARIRLGVQAEKFPVNIERWGNMSAASIPVLLDEMLEGAKIKTGDTLVCVGFGAGMTVGTCILVWQ